MHPDPNYLPNLEEAEEKDLNLLLEKLSASKKEEIVSKSKELEKRQSMSDDPLCLPTLTLEDVPRVKNHFSFQSKI